MGSRLVHLGQGEDALVEGVEVRGRLAVHIVPPVTHEEGLVEHGAVGTEERSLPPVQITVMPGLEEWSEGQLHSLSISSPIAPK